MSSIIQLFQDTPFIVKFGVVLQTVTNVKIKRLSRMHLRYGGFTNNLDGQRQRYDTIYIYNSIYIED